MKKHKITFSLLVLWLSVHLPVHAQTVWMSSNSTSGTSYTDPDSNTGYAAGAFTMTGGGQTVNGTISSADGSRVMFTAIDLNAGTFGSSGNTPWFSKTTFEDSGYITTDPANYDIWSVRTSRLANDPVGTTTLMTINFDTPIANPVFHVNDIDRVGMDFSPSVALGLSSVTPIFVDESLTFSGTEVYDVSPGTASTGSVWSSPTSTSSAEGSFKLNGTFSQIQFYYKNRDGSAGYQPEFNLWTLSADYITPVPEPGSGLVASLALLGFAMRRKRAH